MNANSPDGGIAAVILVCSSCEVDGAIVRHGKHGESDETREQCRDSQEDGNYAAHLTASHCRKPERMYWLTWVS